MKACQLFTTPFTNVCKVTLCFWFEKNKGRFYLLLILFSESLCFSHYFVGTLTIAWCFMQPLDILPVNLSKNEVFHTELTYTRFFASCLMQQDGQQCRNITKWISIPTKTPVKKLKKNLGAKFSEFNLPNIIVLYIFFVELWRHVCPEKHS